MSVKRLLPYLSAGLLALLAQPATCQAELVVISSAQSNTPTLSIEQVERLMLGKEIALPNGTTAQTLDLPRGPTRESFYQRVAGRSGIQMTAYWSRMVFTASARPPKEVASEQEMIDQVLQHPGRIGYVDRSAVDARVKILLSLP